MPTFKRRVPLGKAIRWSELEGDVLLDLATPTEQDIIEAQTLVTKELKPFLDGTFELVDIEDKLIG